MLGDAGIVLRGVVGPVTSLRVKRSVSRAGPESLAIEIFAEKAAGKFDGGERARHESGGDEYSVSCLYLDITPVRMSRPLYSPWR